MAILHKRPRDEGDWPTVVMFHDGPGVRNATHVFAAKLAAEGYAVAVPDLYHRHGRMIGFEPEERAADPALVDRLWELLASLTDAGIQSDLDATLAALRIDPSERLGAIGFCVGARAAFRTLMRLPDQFAAGALWHPSFLADDEADSPHLSAGALTRPLFIGIGDCGHDAAARGAPALSRRGGATRPRRGRGVPGRRSRIHLARLAELRRERRLGVLPQDDVPVPGCLTPGGR